LTFVALFSFQSSTAALKRLYHHNKLQSSCQQVFYLFITSMFALAVHLSDI